MNTIINTNNLLDFVFCIDGKETEVDVINALIIESDNIENCSSISIFKIEESKLEIKHSFSSEYSIDIELFLKNYILENHEFIKCNVCELRYANQIFTIYNMSGYGYFVIGSDVVADEEYKYKFSKIIGLISGLLCRIVENELLQQAKTKLLEESNMLRSIIDNIPVSIYAKDIKYKKFLANFAELKSLGKKDEIDVLGKTDFEIYNDSIAENSFKEDKAVIENGDEILGVEKYMGNDIWSLVSKIPLRNQAGQITGLLGVSVDYTQKKKIQEQLVLFMNIFDYISDSIVIFHENGKLFYINKAASEQHGIKKEELSNYSVLDLDSYISNIDDWNKNLEIIKENDKIVVEFEKYNKKTAVYFPAEVTLNYVEENGKGYVIANSRDVTERKKSEEQIKENEIRLEQIALKGRTIAWEIDVEGKYTYISSVVKEVLAYNPDDLVGKEYFFNLQRDDSSELYKQLAFDQMSRNEIITDSVNKHYDKHGNMLWLATTCFPMFNADGTLKGYRGSDTDVTERIVNEQHMAEHEQFQQSLIENISLGIMIIDQDSNIVEEINSFGANILNSVPQNIIGENCSNYLPENLLIFNNINEGIAVQSDDYILTVTGDVTPVISKAKRIVVKSKAKILLSFIDITDRKSTEIKLRESEDRKSSLIQSINDIVFVLDHDMHFIEIHKPKDIELSIFQGIEIGKQFEDVGLPAESLRIIGEALCSCIESGKFTKAEFSIEDAEINRWYDINVTVLKNSAGFEDGLTCVLRDITDQRERAETIRQQIKLQELLINISTKYINIDLNHSQRVINQSLEDMCKFFGADRSYIFTYDLNNNIATNIFEWCDDGIESEIDKHQSVPIEKCAQLLKAHKDGRVFYVKDSSKLPDDFPVEIKNNMQRRGIKSMITIPLKYNDEILGFVGFDSITEKHFYGFKEMQLLELFTQMIVNVTIRKRGVEMLTYQEEKYRNIISNMNLGLVELDVNNNILFANNQFCKMAGINKWNLIGKYAGRLLSPGQERVLLNYKQQMISSTNPPSLELKVSNKNEDNKWWLVNGAPQYNDKKEIVGSVGVFLDITKQKSLLVELEKAKQIAEKAAKAKEQFLTNMSHEIRTPLNVIIGMVRELGIENLTANQRMLVDHSEASASHLLTIVNNILDMSKIEAGEFSLDNSNFSLSAVLSDVKSILSSKAKSKNLKFDVKGDDCEQLILHGDVIHLRQILINLLSNSIKFTDEGMVGLNVMLLESRKESFLLRFEITDTGIGMSSEFQKRVFEKFTQEQDKNNRSFEGTGLGMSISNQLVSLMGGNLLVESEINKGTKIWFNVEFKAGDKTKIFIAAEHRELINLRNLNILLVEDNEMNRFIARQSLARMHCNVQDAINGLEAIEKVQNSKFDIILMDIQMPKMDGVSATKYIRNELNNNTPILALTANAFKHDVDLYLSVGMNDILLKPYKEDDLFKKIEQNVNTKLTAIIPEKEEELIERTEDKSELYCLDELRQIGQGDESFLNTMVEMFVKIASDTVLSLNEALVNPDLDVIKKLAHKIKPSIDNMGITKIHDEIRELEAFDINIKDKQELDRLVKEVSLILNEVIVQLQLR